VHSQSANVGLYTYLHHIYQCHSTPKSLSPLGLIYALRELSSEVKPITGSNDSPYSFNIKPQQTRRYIPIHHLKKNFNLFPALPFSLNQAFGTPTSQLNGKPHAHSVANKQTFPPLSPHPRHIHARFFRSLRRRNTESTPRILLARVLDHCRAHDICFGVVAVGCCMCGENEGKWQGVDE
jgi:hypothetical protein